MTSRVMRAAMVITMALAAPAFGEPPAAKPWLEVVLPPAPAAGTPTAKLELGLRDAKPVAPDYAGLRIVVGGGAPRLVPVGKRAELVVAASARAPLHLEIGGERVLAHVRPGDTLAVQSGHDGGWTAVIGNRMNENAPKPLTVCGKPDGECPTGYTWTKVFAQDRACPAAPVTDQAFKCIKAPTLRARGPLTGRAEVSHASASGALDELDTVPLAPVAAGALSPPIFVGIGREAMPRVRIGDASAMLVIGPGDSYDVWLDASGRVESAQTATK